MFRIHRIYPQLLHRRLGHGGTGMMGNDVRHVAESPELPPWLNCSQGENYPTETSQDDFFLPSRFDSLDDRPSIWSGNEAASTTVPVPHEGTSDHPPVDDLCTVLSSGFTSPDAVVRALDGRLVNVSTDYPVCKILKRYSNDWVSAFGFFKWADATRSGYKHSADAFDSMVDILGKSKQFEAMWSLIEEMVRGKFVSLSTMSKVMRRLAGAGRWKDAVDTFRNMEQFGVKRDTLAMNSLLDTLCKERSVMRARDVFFETRDSIPPDASTFNILIHGWCKAGKLEEARWTMEEMRGSGFSPCVISYTSLIEAHCLDKNFRAVDAVLEKMQANGCPPNVVTYTIVMHSLGKAKETREALRVYDTMKKNGCVPDTSFFNSLIYILCRAGRLRDANGIYKEMNKDRSPPNLTTYNTLISAACLHSQEEDALKLLMTMQEAACKPDIETYAPLLKYCCRRKRLKILYFLLGDMLKKDVSLDLGTYTLLVQGLCKNGELHHSCLFFEKMVLKGFVPRQHTCKMLMEELERKKLHKEIEKIAKLIAQGEEKNRSSTEEKRQSSVYCSRFMNQTMEG